MRENGNPAVKRSRNAFALVFMAVLVFSPVWASFQNCGKFDPLGGGGEIASFKAAVDGFDANCLESRAYDACIYFKHPYGQPVVGGFRGPSSVSGGEAGDAVASFTGGDGLALDRLQTFGILLSEEERAALSLANPTLRIVSRLRPDFDGKWLVPWSEENHSILAHLMTYYWGTRAVALLADLGDADYLDGKGLTIRTDASITGWSSANASVYLATGEGGASDHAFDAGVLVHLLGEANIFFATQGRIYDLTQDTKHLDCGLAGKPLYKGDCCASASGCSRAVTAALSDHLVALLFRDMPAVADGARRDPRGAVTCEISRDPAVNVQLSARDAFEACAGEGRQGQIFAMSAMYASLWWSVRRNAQTTDARLVPALDQLYGKLLARLDGSDDFITVLDKIRALDASDFGNRLSSLFEVEYQRRGLL